MSFPFGGRSSFSDRTMGKSGEEVIDDLLKNIKQRKKEFFESPPKWRSTGMFDSELGGPGASSLKAHLGDLAARHPELADHLLDILPDDTRTGYRPAKASKAEAQSSTFSKNNKKEGNTPLMTTTGTQTGGLESDTKLRNTVPDMQATSGENEGDRGQRSQSAPPQASTVPPLPGYQKDEGARTIPMRTDSPSGIRQPQFQQSQPQTHHFQQGLPHHFQQGPPHHFQEPPQQGPGGQGPTIRHIPIFVEGRDEPLLPKDVGPSPMQLGGCQGKAAEEKRTSEKQQHSAPHPQQHHAPPPQQQPPHRQQQQQQQAPPAPPPPSKPDPLAQVAEIAKEVDALREKVNEWNGTTRAEKDYIFLDEMLTRNLLKLDNIETEGRDEVRTARKDTIKRIQAAISVLESKAADNLSSQNNQQSEGELMELEVAEGTSKETQKEETPCSENIQSMPSEPSLSNTVNQNTQT